MRVLRDEVRSHPESIRVLEFNPAVELLTDGQGRVTGAVLLDLETREYRVVSARAVILTTGGGGRLHYQGFPTTNHYGATADGIVLAYRVGGQLAFLHTMQYHPTGVAYPEQIVGQLVTEKVRGLGAQVCNIQGGQFVFPLETRDVEAASFIRECQDRKRGVETPTGQPGVWLDSPTINLIHGPGTIEKELPAMVRQIRGFDIDIVRQPMLVYPTLHYPVRLGQSVFSKGVLDQTAFRQAEEAFLRFRHVADTFGVERMRAVATSAAREAANSRSAVGSHCSGERH